MAARRLLTGLALALASASLAACASSSPAPEGDGAATPRPAEVSGDPDTWPLTGLPVESGRSVRKHPVLVLKMDNTASSAPQVGLSHADLVIEELVEGGVTRLAAFYYSDLPDDVGPVRSVRASDIGIVSPVNGRLVTSGGARITLQRLSEAGIGISTEGSAGFYRNSGRYAPYNLFTSMAAVGDAQRLERAARPPDYLPFGDPDLDGAAQATAITVRFSNAHTTTWAYRAGTYVNRGGHAASGDAFPADSVLVLKVDVGDAGYTDAAGNSVPETRFTGSGEAVLFTDGKVVSGTWEKDGLEAVLTLQGDDGVLAVPPGHTWIELIPKNGGSLTY